MSDDPRFDSTRRWSRGKLTLYIVGIIGVFLVASSVFWLPLLVGPGDTGPEDDPPAAAANPP